MESRWEFTAPQFVDFAAMDPDEDLEEDKFFDVNNETREEEEEERVRVKLPFPTPGFQSCYNSEEEEDENGGKQVEGGNRQKSNSLGSSRRAPLMTARSQLGIRRGGGRNMAERNLFKASASRSRASYGSLRGPVAVLNAQKKNIVGKKTGPVFRSQAEQVARSGKRSGGVPARQQLPNTEPTPFQLKGSKRLQQRAAAWQAEVVRKQELEREAHKFKAKEAVVLRAVPFVPQTVQRAAVPIIQGPDLCTDRRAMEREKYEARRREREVEAEAIKVREQEEKYQEELQQVAEQRKQAVHKARPVPKYTRLQVVASQKKPTTATSPYLLTKRNAKGSKC